MELTGDFSSVSEAKEYLMPNKILSSHKAFKMLPSYLDAWVIWSNNLDENSVAHRSIEERIRRVLITPSRGNYTMVQFWAVEGIAGNKCILTTSNQPFSIYGLNKCYYSYRKECMRRSIDVSPEANKAQLGPPGRAFKNLSVEFSPDIRLYTIQEFALRDHAILCDLYRLVSLPVFELDNNKIVGVLELLYPANASWLNPELAINLKVVGLRINYNGSSESVDREKYPDDIAQVHKMFNEVAKKHPLALGLAFAPCRKEHCLICSGKGCLDKPLAVYKDLHMNSLRDFYTQRNGISGRAYGSGKSCFCRDIRNLSILEYPLAHHARLAGLTFSFATCVKSIHDENNVLVLEFLLLPGSYNMKNIRSFTESLLIKIKEALSYYNVAEADFPGEELFPDIYEYDNIDHVKVVGNPLSLPETLSCSCGGKFSFKCQLNNAKEVVDFFLPVKLNYVVSRKNSLEGSSENYYDGNAFIFWRNDEKLDELDKRIKTVFELVDIYDCDVELVQFWAPRRVGGRSFLSTSDQPFVIRKDIRKVTCLYRKECMRRNNEYRLGPVGRAFENGVVEFSPDVKLYTVKEFPLRDHAVLWDIRRAVFLPVFELDGKGTVGILEILFFLGYALPTYLNQLTIQLKEVRLRIDYVHPQQGQSDSQAEIAKIFEAVSVRCPLQLARALTPSLRDCLLKDANLRYINLIWPRSRNYITERYLMAGSFHQLLDKNGVAGKALASRRSFYCREIDNWGITEYPLSHYAELFGCNFSVAICVENTQLVEAPCVLEFFLLPGDYNNENIWRLLDSLLKTLKELLPPNFKILSEHVPGEPFFLEIGKHLENGTKAIISGVHGAAGGETYPVVPQENNFELHIDDYPEDISSIHIVDGTTTFVIQTDNNYEKHSVAGTEATALDIRRDNINDMPVADGIEVTPPVPQGDNICVMHVAAGTRPIAEGESNCSTNPSMSQMEGNKFHISFDELKLQFGKPLNEVAENLGVSRSTLKRIRKCYGIHRWPSHKKNKVNQSLFMKPNPNDAPRIVEDTTLGSSEVDSPRPVLTTETCIHSTHDLQTVQQQAVSYGDNEVDKILRIRASYGDGAFIRFNLNSSSTLQDLQEQIMKRLRWEANRYEIKYRDEDMYWISIIIDEDLKDCFQASIDRCESTISLSINLKLG